MTDNKKLIEEAAKAIMEESHGEGSWDLREPIEDTLYRRRAEAALAVFEKAHTPTNDEREALALMIAQIREANHPNGLNNVSNDSLAHAILVAGFHRSVWHERTNAQNVDAAARAIFDVRDDEFDMTEWDDLTSADKERYLCDARAALCCWLPSHRGTGADSRGGRTQAPDRPTGNGSRPQPVSDVMQFLSTVDLLSWAIAPMSEIGEHSSANDPWENAIEYAEARVWAEPQGEPSDAHMWAAMGEAWGFRARTRPAAERRNAEHWFTSGWRAALRAAGVVAQEGAEADG